MSQPVASSSRQVPFPPPPPVPVATEPADPYERLSFEPASQAQILRAHQRDTSQIHRLTELTSELIRSVAGTRWLAHKQTAIDLIVKALYLFLTFGRGSQTLGEEYTDILPYSNRQRRTPSGRRRILTILLLLLPSIISSPSTIQYLRSLNSSNADPSTNPWRRLRLRIAQFLESPLGQSLPELHMVVFLFRGKFFEVGRRLTGVSYISTLPAKPIEARAPSYEPLALLMALPLIYRLFPRSSSSNLGTGSISTINRLGEPPSVPALPNTTLPPSPPLTPTLEHTAEETIIFDKPSSYDTPNTYLTPTALALPERQCTLCLESRGTGEGSGGTVGVTECGHVFCWGCLGGLDKLECPLCRQTLRMERLVAAYNL